MKTLRMLLALALLMSLLSGCNTCEHRWQDADCSAPRTCSLCGETQGEPTGKHQWEEATTERPKTCSVCHLTEGDAIETDERFTTAACKPLFGNWEAEYKIDGTELGILNLKIDMKMTITFGKDGEMLITTQPKNMATFQSDFARELEQMMYAQYSAQGMDRSQADAACQAQHGKTVPEFCSFRTTQIAEHIKTTEECVYYVEDGLLYISEDWDSDMQEEAFEITEDGKLMLRTEFAEEPQPFTRVAIAK